jgi:Na+/H+ antiporter NhaD/arsenite permease-like protein
VIIYNEFSTLGIEISFIKTFFVLFPGALLLLIITIILIRVIYYKHFGKIKKEVNPLLFEVSREIEVWESVAREYESFSEVKESLSEKIEELKNKINLMNDEKDVNRDIIELEKKYVIKDKVLLGKSIFILVLIILFFSISEYMKPVFYINLPFISLIGATSLMIISDINHISKVLEEYIGIYNL